MSQPRYAKVDPADYKRLRKYEWFVIKKGKLYYVRRHAISEKGKENLIYLHQEIIKVPKGMVIDHINHDAMDNRCANLRPSTHSQNLCNRRKRPGAMYSRYKGVSWIKETRKWVARITFEKKGIHLGTFKNEIDAARAYDEAARRYHKDFACLNFPD